MYPDTWNHFKISTKQQINLTIVSTFIICSAICVIWTLVLQTLDIFTKFVNQFAEFEISIDSEFWNSIKPKYLDEFCWEIPST